MIFHALDVFSIIFATVYVEVKVGARMSAILSASAMYMYSVSKSDIHHSLLLLCKKDKSVYAKFLNVHSLSTICMIYVVIIFSNQSRINKKWLLTQEAVAPSRHD